MLDMRQMTVEQLDAELQKGYDDVLNGRTIPAQEAFERIRCHYGISIEPHSTDKAIQQAEEEYEQSGQLTDARIALAALKEKHFDS